MTDATKRRDPPGAVAVYPGSFDPITNGHLYIIERAIRLFSRVIVAVGQHPDKPGFLTVEERRALITESTKRLERVEVGSFEGLVVNFCRSNGATALVRGLRAAHDFEQEFRMGLANRDMAPEIETVFLIPEPGQMFVSSSLVREIAGHGGNFERYVPPPVVDVMRKRLQRGG